MLISDENALAIVRALAARGFTAYYAGGCVRDAVLGRPYEDIDIATDARPRDVSSLFPRSVGVGAHFGVVKVLAGKGEYDVATFRSDGEYLDGRRPEAVTFSSPREDALRRDITINGMFYDPVRDEIIDYVGGMKDIERRIVRAIGDPRRRIAEDKLRMMRIVRFAGILGFGVDRDTMEAVREKRGEIGIVSVERIQEELARMFGSGRPADCLSLLVETGLMDEIVPEVTRMKGVEQPPEFHPEGDVFEHTMLMMRFFQEGMGKDFSPSLVVALSILFHDVGKPLVFRRKDRIRFSGHCVAGARLAEGILKRLRFPNAVVERVCGIVRQHMRFMDAPRMRESTLKRFLRQEGFADHLVVHRLDCMASHGDMSIYEFCTARLRAFEREQKRFRPPRLVTGHDLIEEGYRPGPLFKEILEWAEDLQLEGRAETRDALLARIREQFPPPGAGEGGKVGGKGEK